MSNEGRTSLYENVRKEETKMMTNLNHAAEIPRVYFMGGAKRSLVLCRQLAGCTLYMNPSQYVLRQNHIERWLLSSYLSSDVEVQKSLSLQRWWLGGLEPRVNERTLSVVVGRSSTCTA